MAGNSKLAMAIHVAGALSFAECVPMTSERIAESCATNPVVIRRIIGLLAKHRLVEVKKGVGGGARLARNASQISLAEIYDAVKEGAVFEVPALDESHQCAVGKIVRPVLAEVFAEAENDLRNSLASRSLADVITLVKLRMPCSGD